jgi:hypothetical protein
VAERCSNVYCDVLREEVSVVLRFRDFEGKQADFGAEAETSFVEVDLSDLLGEPRGGRPFPRDGLTIAETSASPFRFSVAATIRKIL